MFRRTWSIVRCRPGAKLDVSRKYVEVGIVEVEVRGEVDGATLRVSIYNLFG